MTSAHAATGSHSVERLFAFFGLLAIGTFPTFLITVVLGSIGVSFMASGAAVFVAGVLGLAGVVQLNDPPIYAVIVGPPLAVVGAFALAGLIGYFWLASKVVRKVLPA
jgi:hypothetical protein